MGVTTLCISHMHDNYKISKSDKYTFLVDMRLQFDSLEHWLNYEMCGAKLDTGVS